MGLCPNRLSPAKVAREREPLQRQNTLPLWGEQREKGTLEAPGDCVQAALLPGECHTLFAGPNLFWETKGCTGTNTIQVPKTPGCSLGFLIWNAWTTLESSQDCSQCCYYSQLKVPLRYHIGNYYFFFPLIWWALRISLSAQWSGQCLQGMALDWFGRGICPTATSLLPCVHRLAKKGFNTQLSVQSAVWHQASRWNWGLRSWKDLPEITQLVKEESSSN